MTKLAALVLAAAVTPAAAKTLSIKIYTTPAGSLLLRIDPDGLVQDAVGTGKPTGPVRCFLLDDKLEIDTGRGPVGVGDCFVAIDRAGKLHEPPAGKRWVLPQLVPALDNGLEVDGRDGVVQLTIEGEAGNALALWIDCESATGDKRGDVRCVVDGERSAFHSWRVEFAVGKGGALKPVK